MLAFWQGFSIRPCPISWLCARVTFPQCKQDRDQIVNWYIYCLNTLKHPETENGTKMMKATFLLLFQCHEGPWSSSSLCSSSSSKSKSSCLRRPGHQNIWSLCTCSFQSMDIVCHDLIDSFVYTYFKICTPWETCKHNKSIHVRQSHDHILHHTHDVIIHWQDESYACWASQDVTPFPPRILQLSVTWCSFGRSGFSLRNC